MSVKVGLLATLHAKPEKSEDVAKLLTSARQLAAAENKTITWYAFKIDENTYGIFDTFEGEDGRQAHLNGEIAQTLMAQAPELLAGDPDIQQIEVIAVK